MTEGEWVEKYEDARELWGLPVVIDDQAPPPGWYLGRESWVCEECGNGPGISTTCECDE